MILWVRIVCIFSIGLILPFTGNAQSVGIEINGLHAVLEQLYDQMIPRFSSLIGVGRGIAGFAATWYIAVRV